MLEKWFIDLDLLCYYKPSCGVLILYSNRFGVVTISYMTLGLEVLENFSLREKSLQIQISDFSIANDNFLHLAPKLYHIWRLFCFQHLPVAIWEVGAVRKVIVPQNGPFWDVFVKKWHFFWSEGPNDGTVAIGSTFRFRMWSPKRRRVYSSTPGDGSKSRFSSEASSQPDPSYMGGRTVIFRKQPTPNLPLREEGGLVA